MSKRVGGPGASVRRRRSGCGVAIDLPDAGSVRLRPDEVQPTAFWTSAPVVATEAVRIGPSPGDQPAVPPQGHGRGDQAMTAQHGGKVSDQSGEHGSVGPVRAGLGVRSAEYGDLVAQDEQLNVLTDEVRPSSTNQPEKPVEDQIVQSSVTLIAAGGRPRPTSGTP